MRNAIITLLILIACFADAGSKKQSMRKFSVFARAGESPTDYVYSNAAQIAYWTFDTTNAAGFPDSLGSYVATSMPNVASGPVQQTVYGANKAAYFNGTNYFQTGVLPISLNLGTTNKLTFMAWVKCADVEFRTFASKPNGTNQRLYYHLHTVVNPKKWRSVMGGAVEGQGTLISTSTASSNVWTHFAVVQSNGVLNGRTWLYINGVLEDGPDDITPYSTVANPFQIGAIDGAFLMKGWLDEIRFITNSVPSNDVYDVYLNTKSRFGL